MTLVIKIFINQIITGIKYEGIAFISIKDKEKKLKLSFEITDPFVKEKLRLQIKIRRKLFADVMLKTVGNLKPAQQVIAELLYEPLNVCKCLYRQVS